MNDMTEQKKLAKIFTLIELLIGEIDFVGKDPTSSTMELIEQLKKTQEMLEPITEGFYKNKQVRGSGAFIELQNKIDYVINKVYK